jgi:hypothetical protein
MKLAAIVLSTVVTFTTIGYAQNQTNTPGAKRLFNDTSTAVRLGAEPERRPAARSGAPAGGGATQPTPAPQPNTADVTGLMYYVEVIQPSGQALRVNTSQVFHSGQRIRFHVLSNVTGRLTILQSENGGALLPLFPIPQLRGGDNRVEQGKETVIPMAFDNRPGNIRLLLMLVADGVSQPTRAALPPPSAPTPTTTPRPAPQQAPPITQRASNDPPPLANRPAPVTEDEIFNTLKRQTGSKALMIEVDESPSQAATYVVVDARQQANSPAGTVAVEVRLNHQP